MKHLSGSLLDYALDLFADIILGLKGLPGTNTPGACIIKHFMSVIYGFSNLARVFVPGKPFQSSLMFAGEARSLPK